ncbi:MAG: ABC transporter ATP-binding protein [Oligoflexia bacterium]|nr:ABC transporter ATP-binding protein [Oligoflexia bacterium]
MFAIQVKNLQKSFGQTSVLKGVNLFVSGGEQCVIQGASGSGKSTLLHIIAGLETASSGQVSVGSVQVNQLSDDERAQYRNLVIGLIFQFHYLLPSLTSMNNILLPAKIASFSRAELNKLRERACEIARHLGVEHCLEKHSYEMSGGEQQRVNLIRAISLRPKVLLCDEPTGNLDSANSEKVTSLLLDTAREQATTLVVVTHNEKMAGKFSRQILMADGVLSE